MKLIFIYTLILFKVILVISDSDMLGKNYEKKSVNLWFQQARRMG